MARRSHRLWNEDLRPSTLRPWGTYSITSIWFACMHNLGVYTAAAGFLLLGLPAWQALVGVFIGLLILWGATQLMAEPGHRYGIPLPVIARASFGVFGANFPALIRSVAAVAWYGIQTFLASHAVMIIVLLAFPSGETALGRWNFAGLSLLGWLCFLFTWGLQLFIAEHGMETIRLVQNWAGAVVSVVMIVMAAALTFQVDGAVDWSFGSAGLEIRSTLLVILQIAMAMCVVHAPMVLNFCDFTRFAPRARDVARANLYGLPVNGLIFAVTVVAVTTAGYRLFGVFIAEPTQILERTSNRWVVGIGALLFFAATLGVNIVANLVSPAFNFANVAPSRISFRKGALIASVLAIAVMPWKIFNSPATINYFLGTLGAMLGPLLGVIVADYYILRRRILRVDDLYTEDSNAIYHYSFGYNWRAFVAAAAGMVVAVPVSVIPLIPGWASLGWYVGVALGATLYIGLSRNNKAAIVEIQALEVSLPRQ
ncbi:NCS1 family nucleobase:cation symporter-1 [Nocardia sp. NPDC057030]|uniref:NCS1 family nucleobase:cation symporter-1 n=1 Tax=unclassified Nocardia TaxID=2637762 RepID=UPI003631D19C